MTPEARRPDGPIRVLVLDDEAFVLMELEMELRAAGFEPVTASSLRRALEAIEQHAFDVAVLDVNLGRGKTCVPVAERLDELGVPYFIHSGDLDRQGEIIAGLNAPVLPKPTPGYKIAEAISERMAGR